MGHLVGDWFYALAERHGGFTTERIDLADIDLPLFDEPNHPRLGKYEGEHTRRWSALVDGADAYVFVTPEYDHFPPASLVNALQYLSREWAYKPAGFVSYGGVSGGTRSAELIKPVVTTLKMMPMVEAVSLPFFAKNIDEASGDFDPGEVQEKAAMDMLDEMVRWAEALQPLRVSSEV